MRPWMHAINPSTEMNTVGSWHHLIKNLGKREREREREREIYIEVSYSSVVGCPQMDGIISPIMNR